MSKHYTDDLTAGGPTQLHPNIDQGGILIFDCNEVIAGCAEDGESHQLHLSRVLTDEELGNFTMLNNQQPDMEDESESGRADGPGFIWLNTGAIKEEAKAYLLSLTN